MTQNSYTFENTSLKKFLTVMVVDDSALIRILITQSLKNHPIIETILGANNGQQALNMLEKIDVDAVILDIDMPIMDGLETLPKILKINPNIQVIMASSLTKRNAQISLKSLELGACDYVPKPSALKDSFSVENFKKELIEKIIFYTQQSIQKSDFKIKSHLQINHLDNVMKNNEQTTYKLRPWPAKKFQAVCIGASTGGPQALFKIFKDFNHHFQFPIFIVQHMLPNFTGALAEHLKKISGINVFEAHDEQIAEPGCVYLAPGDYHMEVNKELSHFKIKIYQGERENYSRPSVDPLFKSLAHATYGHVLGIMLSGMGTDGLNGAKEIAQHQGGVVSQDFQSSIVWGMPGIIAKAGFCNAIESVDNIRHLLETLNSPKI